MIRDRIHDKIFFIKGEKPVVVNPKITDGTGTVVRYIKAEIVLPVVQVIDVDYRIATERTFAFSTGSYG